MPTGTVFSHSFFPLTVMKEQSAKLSAAQSSSFLVLRGGGIHDLKARLV
jgi:hypothetical protein